MRRGGVGADGAGAWRRVRELSLRDIASDWAEFGDETKSVGHRRSFAVALTAMAREHARVAVKSGLVWQFPEWLGQQVWVQARG